MDFLYCAKLSVFKDETGPYMKKDLKFTLRFSMLSIFLTLFVLTMLTMVTVTSLRFYESMRSISKQQMQQVTSLVNEKLLSLITPAESGSALSRLLIENQIIDVNDTKQVTTSTLRLLAVIPHAAMVYWGDENGNFIIARLENDGTISTEIIDRNSTPTTSTHIYRDKALNTILMTKTEKVVYDPRKRPWYITAKNEKKTTWSDAYAFFSGNNNILGITSASPIYDKNKTLLGVFGIDMRLDSISEFLSKQKIGKSGLSFIINSDGYLIAHPQLAIHTAANEKETITPIKDLNIPWQTKAYDIFKVKHKKFFRYRSDDKMYLASFDLIPNFSQQQWYISVVIPEDDFVGELKKSSRINIVIGFMILFLGSILITTFSKIISRSLHELAIETNKIKRFNLSKGKKIKSHIREVSELNNSISSMKRGLKAFKKYVPADLVRLLINAGESAKLGGSKKEITILFTDIEDFTGKSETLMPEELMHHLCEYFDSLSNVIKNQNGTIDKYIGDSIMAFWGSPSPDKDHCLHACTAALGIIKALEPLNKEWEKEGKPVLPTRIGIHTGDAVVGNVGSSTRLNYTAIGDTINLASRLESINKVYGTYITVSDTVKNKVNQFFIFRPIDNIAVHGKKQSLTIYELLDKNTPEAKDKYASVCEYSTLAFEAYQQRNWDKAIELYSHLLDHKAGDKVSELFIERCKTLKNTPPNKDWDGVWRFTQK